MLKAAVNIVLTALILLWAFVILRSMWKRWKKSRSGEVSSAGCCSCSSFRNGMCAHGCGSLNVQEKK